MAERDTTRMQEATQTLPPRSIWLGGAISGIVACIAMEIFAMGASSAMGQGFWTPQRLTAATFLGVDALLGGGGTILLGLVMHLVAGAVLGVIFALLTPRITSASRDLGLGLLFGIVVWVVATYIALPLIDSVLSDRVSMMPLSWFVQYLVFGAFLGLTPYFERVSDPEGYRRVTSSGTLAHR